MKYKELTIDAFEVFGVKQSIEAMRLPYNGKGDSYLIGNEYVLGDEDSALAMRLINAGSDHAKAMRGVVVWVTHSAMVGWMIEFQTYRHGVEWLSTTSTMHSELKDTEGYALADLKQEGLRDKVYTTSYTISYQALRGIYFARKKHRHPGWRVYCKWIESLPNFEVLIAPRIDKPRMTVLYESSNY